MSSTSSSRRSFLEKGLAATALAIASQGLFGKVLASGPDTGLPTELDPPFGKPNAATIKNHKISAPIPQPVIPEKIVMLIGDGSKLAYEKKVAGMLRERARVISPAVNCGNSLDVMRRMEFWLKEYNPDVVHFSTGVEDVRSLYYGTYENMVPRKFYKRNIRNIIEIVYAFSSKAIPIWSTITPVNDERVVVTKATVKDFTIFNDDVLDYNRDALKVCKQFKVVVNDLYESVEYSGSDSLLDASGYTLNAKGRDTVAKSIASQIENYL
jgi:lysophospholipase L1-like esterase